MKKKLLFIFVGIFLVSTAVFSQEKCDTYQGSLEDQIKKYPDFYQGLEKQNKELEAEHKKALKKLSAYKTESGKKIIPVVVHNIYNSSGGYLSDAQIQSAIDALNRNINGQSDKLLEMYQGQYIKTPDIFAAVRGVANVEFRLAKFAPTCESCPPNPTTGINRVYSDLTNVPENRDEVKLLSYWNSYQYFNIWTVRSFSQGGLLGYAQFPYSGMMSTDGVVLLASEMNNSTSTTLTHEAGHWLNLIHTWGDAPCGSDDVKDTPVQRYDNNGASESSPTPSGHPRGNPALFPYHAGLAPPPGQTGAWGCVADSLNPAGEMFMNFMSYTNDDYATMFSAGQIERVNATLEGAIDEETGLSGIGYREYMCSAENIAATGTDDGYINLDDDCNAKYDFFEQNDRNHVCLGTENWLTSNSKAISVNVTSATWDFGDGSDEVSSDYLTALGYYKKHQYENPGKYDVTFTVEYDEVREVRVSDSTKLIEPWDGPLLQQINTLIVQGTEQELLSMGANNVKLHVDSHGYSLNSFWIENQMTTDDILDATFIDTIDDGLTIYYNGYYGAPLFYRGELEEISYIAQYNSSCTSTIVKENYITIGEEEATNTSYPYIYSFEEEEDLNEDWTLTQPQSIDNEWAFSSSKNTIWQWTDKVSNDGSASIMISRDNMFSGSTEIISSAYDLSDLTTPALKFSWSGAAINTDPSNELVVSYSTTCGKLWSTLGTIDAIECASAGMFITEFQPGANHWNDTIMTKTGLSNDNVMFKFEYIVNGSSNNFYLDNIEIGEESTLHSPSESTSRLSIYPNPTYGKPLVIKLEQLADKDVEVKLVSILGSEVMNLFEGKIVGNVHALPPISLSHLEEGIYFVEIVSDGDTIKTEKLIHHK